jgi:8-oxo-dGTP pyrophosphatase MutT (NUDIX family)
VAPETDPTGTAPGAGPTADPAPAATVVLLRRSPRGAEVLLTRRPSSMAFAPDLDVFPGGRVDEGDRDPRLATPEASRRTPEEAAVVLGGNLAPADALAVHVGAMRELVEEAGVLLVDRDVETSALQAARDRLLGERAAGLADVLADLAGGGRLRLATDRLAPVAQWTTPVFMPRRFATWFFVADLPPGVEPSFHDGEVVGHRWVRPAAALDELAAGASAMWVPTTSVLQQLVALDAGSAADVASAISFGPISQPEIVADGETHLRVVSTMAGGVPGQQAVATLLGRRRVVLIDPGDASAEAVEAIAAAAAERRQRIEAIVLTAPDPGRAAGAEALALPLGIPVLAAPGAGRHLPYETRVVDDGELLPADVTLRVRLGPAGSGRLEVIEG